MRTIVVDDEPWMLKRFAIECEGIRDVQLVGSFKSPLKALAFAKENTVELAFLDIEMPEMNGLQLAVELRKVYPGLVVIFVSAYDNYMVEAFKSRTADYYIMKPYDIGDVEAAIDRARLLSGRLRKKVRVRTFGSFELFVDKRPVVFSDDKAKELLALLVAQCGGVLSEREACLALWPNAESKEEASILYRKTFRRLQDTLKSVKLNGVVEQNDQGTFIHADIIDCDLYQYMAGDLTAMRLFNGEYMSKYPWAEQELQGLMRQSDLFQRYDDVHMRNTICASVRYLHDDALTLTYTNEAFLAIVGYTGDEIRSQLHNSLRAMILREDYDRIAANAKETMSAGENKEIEFRLINKNGDEIWVLAVSEPTKVIAGDGQEEMSSILIDISGMKATQYQLEQSAQRDGLTGLYNRATAQEKICAYLKEQGAESQGALVLMDVDNFKAVNDTYGHPFADSVLSDIAAILERCFRRDDIVCRLGGDEMMVFLKGVKSESCASDKLKEATDAIAKRLSAKTERGEISCSFGGVMCPEDGSDFDTLYQRADIALYAAKEQKGCAVWFSEVRLRMVDKLVSREITAIGSDQGYMQHLSAQDWRHGEESLFKKIERMLGDIGQKYDISRAYVFELTDDKQFSVNTFEWCAEGIRPEKQNLQAMQSTALHDCYSMLFDSDGLFYCYDIRNLDTAIYEILAAQDIKSLLQCALVHDGEFLGMVGFDECRKHRYWSGQQIKSLSAFTTAIGEVLYQYRTEHGRSLEKLQNNA